MVSSKKERWAGYSTWHTCSAASIIFNITSLILFIAILVHFYFYPSIIDRADAWAYQQYGLSFKEHGLLRHFGTFRTYGYPFFLYLLTYPFGTDPHHLALAASVVQYSIFFVGTKALSRAVHKTDPLLGAAVTIGLMLNPFVISLVTDNLTEGLSIGVYIWLVYIAVKLGRATSIYAFASLASLGWLLSAFSIEIRPANISILAGWCMAIAATLCMINRNDEIWSKKLGIMVLAAPLAIIPLLPQMLYNWSNYHTISPMPVCSLGEFQIQYGILAMKYDTVVHGGSAAGYNYPNPLFHGSIEDGWHWYAFHPLAGVGTIFLHLFNVLSITSIFTYIRSEKSFFDVFITALYSSIYVAGSYNLYINSRTLIRCLMLKSWPDRPVIVYLMTSQSITLLICAISAVELRFGVFACGLLSISATMLAIQVTRGECILKKSLIAGLALAITMNVLSSFFIGSFGSEEPLGQRLNFDFGAHRCVM